MRGQASPGADGARCLRVRFTDEQVSTYECDGFVFVPQLLPREPVEAAMGLAASIFDLERPEVIRETDDKTVRSLMNGHRFCPEVDRLIRYRAIIEPVEQILGRGIYIFQCVENRHRGSRRPARVVMDDFAPVVPVPA